VEISGEIMYKTCSKCKELKLFSAFNKNKSKKDGFATECKVCTKKYNSAYYSINKDELLSQMQNYREINKDKLAIQSQKYYLENKNKILIRAQEYYEVNRDACLIRMQEYGKNNPSKIAAHKARYRAAKFQATPSWLTVDDHRQIEEFYRISQQMQLSTCEEYHVDHIVPLQGENVCGLHVPWNLQVIPAKENLSKSNKLQEEIL
jgi:hypothetical protein